MKMIEEAAPRPDDVCEIDGDNINEVSIQSHIRVEAHVHDSQ